MPATGFTEACIASSVAKTADTCPLWLRIAAALVRQLPVGRYRATAFLARRVAKPFLARLPAAGGLWFQCDARDASAAQAYFAGAYEPQETALIKAVLVPDSTFVDVGANWGYYTLLAAQHVGARGSVIAIEPDPRMCAALRANLALNGFSKVAVLEIAAAEHRGTLPLLAFDPAGGNYGVSRLADPGSEPISSMAVAARPLDDVLVDLGLTRVSLLKMDIEGGEAAALAGLRKSLEAGIVERILLEVHPRELEKLGTSADEVFELLRGAGYQGWAIDHSPRANRRAAYARRLVAQEYLRPFHPGQPLDAWPHLLWTRTGKDLLPLKPAPS